MSGTLPNRRRNYKLNRNLLQVVFDEFDRLPDDQKRTRPSASDFFWQRVVPAVTSFVACLREVESEEVAELLGAKVGHRPKELSSLNILQVIWGLGNQPVEDMPVTPFEWKGFIRRREELELRRTDDDGAEARFIYEIRMNALGTRLCDVVSDVREAVTIVDVYVSGAANTVDTNAPASPFREGEVVQPADTDSTDVPESDSKAGIHPAERPKKGKRSTERGEGQAKLIAALTNHHNYAAGGCLNMEPIGNNKLARLAVVSESTASAFFKKQFGGYGKYMNVYCRNEQLLVAALKKLNDEYTVDALFGGTPPGDSDRDDDD